MKWLAIVSAVCVAGAASADDRSRVRPPVLEGYEPTDSLIVTLPGAPAPPPAPVPAPDEEHRPVLRRAPRPILPAEFERDSGFFCQKLIGAWTERDAYNLFGDPLRERPAFEDDRTISGRIFAYSDPTGRYREIELDFDQDDGLLRGVFVYPWKLSWADCRRQWGANVQSAGANKGRTFYSYLDRRLDVLVDSTGNVVSLGLY
jgi:hypothetical protein